MEYKCKICKKQVEEIYIQAFKQKKCRECWLIDLKKKKDKKCAVCKTVFTPNVPMQKYCSPKCSLIATKKRQRIKKRQRNKESGGSGLSITTLKNKADKLWRKVGKENARCSVCENLPEMSVNYTQLHPHHIVGRKNMTLRWDLRNRIWLCPTHHTLGSISAHNTPMWFNEDFLTKVRPEDYQYLKEKEMIITKVTEEFLLNVIGNLSML